MTLILIKEKMWKRQRVKTTMTKTFPSSLAIYVWLQLVLRKPLWQPLLSSLVQAEVISLLWSFHLYSLGCDRQAPWAQTSKAKIVFQSWSKKNCFLHLRAAHYPTSNFCVCSLVTTAPRKPWPACPVLHRQEANLWWRGRANIHCPQHAAAAWSSDFHTCPLSFQAVPTWEILPWCQALDTSSSEH